MTTVPPGRRARRLMAGAVAAAAAALVLAGCVPVPPANSDPGSSASAEPPAPPPTRLALISDFGTCDAGEQWAADQVDSWNVDAIVTAGDNTQDAADCAPYAESVWGYFEQDGDGPPLWPTLGNHDYTDAGAGLDAYRAAFPYLSTAADAQQRWYRQNVGDVTLFVLDSETTPEELETQRVWLREALTEQRADRPDAWNVVLFHRPAYTSGWHDDNRQMRPSAGWDYSGWGADIVIAGHQHIYEDVVVDGLHYLTAGLGGTANARECPAELREGSRLCLDGTGASLIEATPDEFELQYFRLDAEGEAALGDTIRLAR
ncbi:metallophosphoesterase [Cryobacterium sp. 1639]|uniref:metallophosphoesterase family protein n=1 Tax=Cryobacterium inferilacus TaxID=2866629 RepID=UPI001C73A1CB|nr:metallophosphoesterase [Cryobacterium sp. 1639]MBX0301800.1 metallophosphoesterase [Cryobacterium sp. 1639]